MEVFVELLREDLWQFHKFINVRSWYNRASLALSILTYPLILVLLQLMIHTPLDRVIPFTLAITVCWIPAYVLLWKSRVKRTPSDKGDQLGPQTIGLLPDRIFARSAHSEEFHFWRGVLDVAQNQSYIFVFTDAYKAYLIPKRSFSNPEEGQAFFEIAVSNWKAAQA